MAGKNKPVDLVLAEECMDKFAQMYSNTTDPKILNTYSTSIVYDKEDLINWIKSIKSDSVEIAFGVYTDAFAQKYGVHTNRLTAFVCPYNTTTGITRKTMLIDDPSILNVGTLQP
jgi:hypothetical protein